MPEAKIGKLVGRCTNEQGRAMFSKDAAGKGNTKYARSTYTL